MTIKTRGFTLIELLVVISIIGLMSSMTLAALQAARAKARDAQRIQALAEVRKALALYYDQNGGYPVPGSSVFGMYSYTESASYSNTWRSSLGVALAPYLPTMPQGNTTGSAVAFNPLTFWGTDSAFAYHTNSTGSQYQLFTRLETAHPLRCSTKAYTAKFAYWFVFPAGNSFCSGSYSTSNADLYVVSSD